jgi:membrane protein
MKRVARDIWGLLKDAAVTWSDDHAGTLGAALAFYTMFSLAPLLIIVIVLSSFGFGQDAVRGHLDNQIQGLIGGEGARFVQHLIENAYKSNSSVLAAIIGIVALLIGASGVFVQLRESLNVIWHVREKPLPTIVAILRTRLLSFAMILGVGFLLLVSLVVSTVLSAASGFISSSVPFLETVLPFIDLLVSFTGITFTFALIFKYIPDVAVSWRDVVVGAAVTSLLFSLGKVAIGFYLGNTAVGSTFGAASSLVIILLWAYYSSQIVLYGAEFTRIYAIRFGSGFRIGKNALQTIEKVIETKPSSRGMGARKIATSSRS